ncbi:MAG: hypothetical protein IM582_09640 [Chitinophagaceae bacterium]|nr:hypothetical protein [Chitinophagaceae bacterium]
MRPPNPEDMTMSEDLLHEIREGGIAWTTFNRPQARNAMTFAMYARLAELADEISADPDRIKQLIKKYNPVTESMEGAALHYVCREARIPFLQIRAISNYIGERNKANWDLKNAIENLNQTLIKYIDKLYKLK